MAASKKVKVGEHVVQVYTITQVARLLGKSSATIRKWEQNGWFPIANVRLQRNVRAYTTDMVIKLLPELRKIKNGIAIPQDVKIFVTQAFKEERTILENLKKQNDAKN